MIGLESYSKQSPSGMHFYLNTDGALQVNTGLSAAGGVIQDEMGSGY